MSFDLKKTAAAAAAIICAVSMCGCADTGYVMTVDNMKIRTGIYLNAEIVSYGKAQTEITEVKEEAGDTSEVKDVFVETVDGKNAVDWIKEEAVNEMKRHVAIERLFEQYGLSLSEEETTELSDQINSMWNDDNYYAQLLYQMDTMGEYYESIGIGRDSISDIYLNGLKEEKVFLHYYDKDGLTPVTDDEINAYIKENYANVKYLELKAVDKYGITLKEDEDIAAFKDKINGYVERLNNGESFVEIQYEYDLEQARNEAYVDAEDGYADETAEDKPDIDAYIQSQVDAVSVTKHETEEELETVISKESSSLNEKLTEYIWSIADDSKASLFENEGMYYLVVRDDITTKSEWKENNKTTVLKAMKNDEFDQTLSDIYADYSVELDNYLVNTKYAPDKIKGIMK